MSGRWGRLAGVAFCGLLLAAPPLAAQPEPGRAVGAASAGAAETAASPAATPASATPASGTPASGARVAMRGGDHPGFGRIVFDWPRQVAFREEREPGRLRLFFTAPEILDTAGARRPTRNIEQVAVIPGGVEFRLRAGAEARVYRLGSRLVVDVRDPAGPEVAAAPAPAAAPVLAPSTAASTAPAQAAATPAARSAPGRPVATRPPGNRTAPTPPVAATPPATPAAIPAAIPAPAPASPAPAAHAAGPPPVAPPAPIAEAQPTPLRLVGASAPGAFRLAVSPAPGIAILRRGEAMLLLIDRPLALDPAALRRDPLLAAAEVVPLPGAVLLRLPSPPGVGLRAALVQGHWRFDLTPDAAASAVGLILEPMPGPPTRLALRGGAPGRVVALTDPLTGLPLLLGTVQPDHPGAGTPRGRVLPQAEVLPTSLGAAVLARAETITMAALTDRFLIGAGAGGLRMGPNAGEGPEASAAAMTRAFDIPGGTVAALTERLRAQGAGIAAAAPLTRGPARLAAGETLLGLGQPQEAQAMLALALQEDPRAQADPRVAALQAAAALLAGRLAEAQALASASLPPSDEATLWYAAHAAARGEMAEAAHGFAATLPLLAAYPEPLRLRLLPLVAQALVEGGALPAARRLLDAAPEMPALRLARARLDEAEGRAEQAIAGYAEVARGRDRQARAEALRRSIDLRLATGALDAAGAAAALDAALFAWRGDGREVAARERLAVLRIQAGAPRAALALLRETAALFPDRAASLGPGMVDAFVAALQIEPTPAAMALFEVDRALLPEGERGTEALALLAGRLAALDLADRAATLLTEAIGRAGPEAGARLGARLASLRLDSGEVAAALAALDSTARDDLPDAIRFEHALLRARALARRGEPLEALALLRTLGTGGLPALADLAAETQDWPLAAESLATLAADLPPGPPETVGARLILRAAAAALLAGEEARTAALAVAFTERLAGTPAAAAFATLTGDPAVALLALPRLTRELDLFRNAPPRLEALRAGGPVTR